MAPRRPFDRVPTARTRLGGNRVDFTSLHRLLGRGPSPLTDEMIDEAVAQGIAETDDLDWKASLPPTKRLNESDFPKDIAAMANSGGGVIVYGISEQEKKAAGRVDTGTMTEVHERSLRSVAVTAIVPPVFGLDIVQLGEEGNRCLAVVVPASADGPHLIYRNEYFGAPIRNNADTVWMKEHQIEAMYRARFEERRHTAEALDHLYSELVAGRDTDHRAWLIAVGRPRVTPTTITRWDRRSTATIQGCQRANAPIRTTARHPTVGDRRHPEPAPRSAPLGGCAIAACRRRPVLERSTGEYPLRRVCDTGVRGRWPSKRSGFTPTRLAVRLGSRRGRSR